MTNKKAALCIASDDYLLRLFKERLTDDLSPDVWTAHNVLRDSLTIAQLQAYNLLLLRMAEKSPQPLSWLEKRILDRG